MELPADVRPMFEAPNFAHLATVLPGGGPHTLPLWAGIEDGKIAFLTSPGSRKARNLAADPGVAIPVIDNAQPYARPRSAAGSPPGWPARKPGTSSTGSSRRGIAPGVDLRSVIRAGQYPARK